MTIGNPRLTEQHIRIHQLLTDLGRYRWQVARNLRRAGITGTVADPHRCPIANYLRAHGEPDTSISGMYAYPADHRRPPVRLPVPVRRFITKFDTDDYPDLRDTTR
jgi:hypothetical protein